LHSLTRAPQWLTRRLRRRRASPLPREALRESARRHAPAAPAPVPPPPHPRASRSHPLAPRRGTGARPAQRARAREGTGARARARGRRGGGRAAGCSARREVLRRWTRLGTAAGAARAPAASSARTAGRRPLRTFVGSGLVSSGRGARGAGRRAQGRSSWRGWRIEGTGGGRSGAEVRGRARQISTGWGTRRVRLVRRGGGGLWRGRPPSGAAGGSICRPRRGRPRSLRRRADLILSRSGLILSSVTAAPPNAQPVFAPRLGAGCGRGGRARAGTSREEQGEAVDVAGARRVVQQRLPVRAGRGAGRLRGAGRPISDPATSGLILS